MERVAARSGVAKTTLYRRFRSKNELALAVLLDSVGDLSTQPYGEDTRTELVRLVDHTVGLLDGTLLGRVLPGLVAEIASDPELATTYRARVVSLRLADVAALVERGVARGELRPDLDPELVTNLLLGPVYYRFLLSGAPMSARFGQDLVTVLAPALEP